jgi:hypothetical protein
MAGDMPEDDPGRASASDWPADAHSPADSTKSESDHDDAGLDAPSQPIQKRRRVTRACDECRRKKIKCDGKQPCTHCSVYSYGTPAPHSKLALRIAYSLYYSWRQSLTCAFRVHLR